jgi:lysozyme
VGIKVVDIASWQHPNGAPIDWEAVIGSGVLGVIIKATQGVGYLSPYFHDDCADAHAAGLMVGAYHFAQPQANPADSEAAYFLANVQGMAFELGLWLDLEEWGAMLGSDVTVWGEAFLAIVSSTGVPGGLYTNRNGLDTMLNPPWGYRLWEATGGADPRPDAWLVQTGQGAVAGIQGAVDLDNLVNPRSVNPPGNGGPLPLPVPTPAPSESEIDDMTVAAIVDPATGKARVFAADHDGDLIERTEQPDGTWKWTNRDADSSNGVPPSISADPIGTHPDGTSEPAALPS